MFKMLNFITGVI